MEREYKKVTIKRRKQFNKFIVKTSGETANRSYVTVVPEHAYQD